MHSVSIINTPKQAGVHIFLDDAKLKKKPMENVLTASVIDLIKNYKDDIVKKFKTQSLTRKLPVLKRTDGEIQQGLAQIYAKLLKIPLKLIAEVRSIFAQEISLKFLFKSEDLKSLARLINSFSKQADIIAHFEKISQEQIEEFEF